jgi:tRNA uridine 5-carbamoylmethylation protein Kti12
MFWENLKSFYYKEIQELFQFLEEKNIKCYMIAMENDYQGLIEKDESMMKRFIEIEYDGKTFNNFSSLSEYNKKLIICNDTDFFDKPPKDLHPGLEWQRIVASSIIKKMETDLS